MTNNRTSTPTLLEPDAQRLITYARRQAASIELWASIVSQPDLAEDALPGLKVLRRIGRGGQSFVYEAVHLATRHRVAVKVLNRRVLDRPHEVARFRREAEILSRVRHPHIVILRDANFNHDHPHLVMDFVDGEALDDFIERTTPSIETLLDLFIKISDALNTAHVLGIVHRDLKPANIIVDEKGEPHVVDFGLAKLKPGAPGFPSTDSITEAGQFVGSHRWSSPEQAREDDASVGSSTDVYALGLMLYHALTGRFPYDVDGSLGRVLLNIQECEPIRPRRIRRDVDHDLETIVLHCLNKDPARRYAGAAALAQDLENRLRKRPISIKGDSTFYLARMAMRRHRGWTAAAVVAVVATIAYASTMTAMVSRTRQAEKERAMELAETQHVVAKVLKANFRKLNRIAGTKEVRVELTHLAMDQLQRIAAQGMSEDPHVRESLAISHSLLGEFAFEDSDYVRARTHLDEAVRLWEGLAGQFSSSSSNYPYHADYSIALVKRGDVVGRLGEKDQQLELYRRALHLDEHLVTLQPENATYLDNLAWSYQRMLESNDALDADIQVAYPEKIRVIAERLVATEPNNAVRRWLLFYVKCQDLREALDRGVVEEIERETMDVAGLAESLMRLEPHNPLFARGISQMLVKSAWYSYERADYVRSQDFLDAAQHALNQLPVQERAARRGLLAQVEQLSLRASVSWRLGDETRHHDSIDMGISLLKDAERIAPGDTSILSKSAYFHVMLARVYLEGGDQSRGEAIARKAMNYACQVLEHPNANAGDLVSIAGQFAWIDPPAFRDPGQAIAAMERARTAPGYRRDAKFVSWLARFLAEDGQSERACELAYEALSLLSPSDHRNRRILVDLLASGDHVCFTNDTSVDKIRLVEGSQ